MNKNKRPLKTMVFSLGLAAMLLPATSLSAQNNGSRGLFGLGDSPAGDHSQSVNYGLINQQFGVGVSSSFNLDNQQFGVDEGGFNLTNQTFGQEAPAGSGLAIFLLAGVGYASLRSKKRKQLINN